MPIFLLKQKEKQTNKKNTISSCSMVVGGNRLALLCQQLNKKLLSASPGKHFTLKLPVIWI